MQPYFGIDLGTTNSAIAFGIGRSPNTIEPRLIGIENRKDWRGRGTQQSLLPSCVYYENTNSLPEVGNYAKTQFWDEPLHVAKSTKPYMNSDSRGIYPYPEASVTYTPTDVSTAILKHLKAFAEDKCGNININDYPIKITVPVSFDDAGKDATVLAAQEAGLLQIRDKGDLILEPHAALYNFCNGPSASDSPIDFSKENRILVFDLGGGTLDVSLHEVSEQIGKPGWDIEDITDFGCIQFGGDDFDEQVAKELLKKHADYVDSKLKKPEEIDSLSRRLQARVQEAKENFTEQIVAGESSVSFLIELPMSPTNSKLGDFNHNLQWDDYKGFINDFLAPDLKLCSPETDYSTREKNIISPILKVLNEAGDSQIDVVLLNGGMTRLPIIRERLEKFFENPNIVRTEEKPDEAVACGAVVYQHLH